MPYNTIKYEKEDGVALITLNRPHALNAFSRELSRELTEAVEEAENDDAVRVLVITGAPRADGQPCFSAGADIKEVADKGLDGMGLKGSSIANEVEDITKIGVQVPFQNIYDSRKPIIAAIDGICTAGGIELAEACDIRLVSETAQISDMHIKNLGLIGGGGATAYLPRLVGPAMAKEMVFTGTPIDGKEAFRTGFANHVYPPDKLMQGAMELAKKIASMDPTAIRMAKASINASMDMDIRQALIYSRLCFAAHSPEEGFDDFVKRSEDRKAK